MRDGNIVCFHVTIKKKISLERSYEGWKLFFQFIINSDSAIGLERSYEGWKPDENVLIIIIIYPV